MPFFFCVCATRIPGQFSAYTETSGAQWNGFAWERTPNFKMFLVIVPWLSKGLLRQPKVAFKILKSVELPYQDYIVCRKGW